MPGTGFARRPGSRVRTRPDRRLLRRRRPSNQPGAQELIKDAIRALRELSVELSPRILEEQGLAPALEGLGGTVSERSGVAVRVRCEPRGRLPEEAERALYRLVQAALAAAVERGTEAVDVDVRRRGGRIVVLIAGRGGRDPVAEPILPAAVGRQLRVLGGRLSTLPAPAGELLIRAELPDATAGRRGVVARLVGRLLARSDPLIDD